MAIQVVLYPRIVPIGTGKPAEVARVWIGVRGAAKPPTLEWSVDGAAVSPVITHRPLQSPRSSSPLKSAVPPRAFAGVFDLPLSGTRSSYVIAVKADRAATADLRHTPQPSGLSVNGEWLNILLVSCFHFKTSPAFAIGAAVDDVRKALPPALSLLMGDQVYLDLPTIKNFPNKIAELAEKFEGDYCTNWFEADGYARVLAAAPGICMPDDHEYWNNAPHSSPIIQNSWTAAGRSRWSTAARAMFDTFQTQHPLSAGEAVIVDIPPVSIFAADTRTERQEDGSRVMSASQMQALEAWIARLNADKLIGVFASGQSVFDPPASKVNGTIGDWALANYDDFPTLSNALSKAQGPLLMVTGDVHWGRMIQVYDKFESRMAMYELVTSPASLVESVGADQWKETTNWLRSHLGRMASDWPRHSQADMQPVWRGTVKGRYDASVLHAQLGDQIAVLSLRLFGGRVQARITYIPVHPQAQRRRMSQSPAFSLSTGLFPPSFS